jgi:hypothetical protein
LNTKLQKTIREIERTKAKIAELQKLLPELEKQKTEIENSEVIKAFRTADVTPAQFADFIKAFRSGTAPAGDKYAPKARPLQVTELKPDQKEGSDHE